MLPDRFEVLGELGRGGMGVVYRARDRHDGREVAVKLLAAGVRDGSTLKRFSREAEELAQLSHPNVVAGYGTGEFEGREYLVMELVDGGNLLDWLAHPRPWRQLVELFIGLCAGLQHIHGRGLVHRDLKPENVLLTRDGIPKIADLGLARRMEGRSRLTNDGAVVGTYAYVAPEQVLSSQVGPAADLYALGAVMFEAFTGRLLFQAESEYALLQCHIREVPASPRALRPDLPPGLERLILRLLKKRAQERPASAREVARLLEGCESEGSEGLAGELWGRGDDVGRIEQALSRCQQGQGVACLLSAPRGVGRSRVVEQACHALSAYGIRLQRLVPQVAPPAQGLGPLLERLIEGGPAAAAQALRDSLEPQTLLVADDVERLDSATQAVLRCLARLAPPPGAGWLLSSAGLEEAHPAALIVELSPLLHEVIQALAARLLGGELEEDLGQWLGAQAGGSPRRLKLLALGMRRAGLIRSVDNRWQGRCEYPDLLAGLEEPHLRLLRAACLLEEPFALEILQGAVGGDSEAPLARLVAEGLLEEAWALRDRYLFTCPNLRAQLADSLSEATRRRAHARLAEVAALPPGSRALHLWEAGQTAEALPLLLEAAETAQRRRAWSEALQLWQRADGSEPRPAQRLHIAVGSAQCLAGAGRREEAMAQLQAWLESPPSGRPEERAARLAAHRLLAQLRLESEAEPTFVLTLCRKALAEGGLPAEPPSTATPGDLELQGEAARVYALMVRCHEQRSEPESMARLLPGALSLARVAALPRLEAELLLLEGTQPGLLKSLQLDPGPLHRLRCQLALGRLFLSDDGAAAAAYLEQALALAQDLCDRQLEGEVQLELARWHRSRRRQGAALDCLHRVLELWSDRPAASVQVLVWLALGYEDSDSARAESLLREALRRADPPFDAEAALFLGHLLRRAGRDVEGLFERALDSFQSQGDPTGEARARLGLALQSRSRPQAEKAVRLLEKAGGFELGLARWALFVATGADESLRAAGRLLGGEPPWELGALVEEARSAMRRQGPVLTEPPESVGSDFSDFEEGPARAPELISMPLPPGRPVVGPRPPFPWRAWLRGVALAVGAVALLAGAGFVLGALTAHPARVELHVEPVPASLVLDGQTYQLKSPNYVASLKPGPHLLRLEAPGRAPQSFQLDLADGQTRRLEVKFSPGTISHKVHSPTRRRRGNGG